MDRLPPDDDPDLAAGMVELAKLSGAVDEGFGEEAPLPPFPWEEYIALWSGYTVGQALGAYWRTPVRIDLEWFLQPGPDPRPISSLDLARISHSIETGGVVLVLATEQAALDIAIAAVEAEVRIGTA